MAGLFILVLFGVFFQDVQPYLGIAGGYASAIFAKIKMFVLPGPASMTTMSSA